MKSIKFDKNILPLKLRDYAIRHREFLADFKLCQRIYAETMLFLARKKIKEGKLLSAINYYYLVETRAYKLPHITEVAMRECIDISKRLFYHKGGLIEVENNPFLKNFLAGDCYKEIRNIYAKEEISKKVTLKGRLLILKKYNPSTGEKGVLIINYTYKFYEFLALFNCSLIKQFYSVVLEPSWYGCLDPVFFHFVGKNFNVFIEQRLKENIGFLQRLNINLIPVKLGSCDWVDFNSFRPLPNISKQYDIVMVGSWAPIKNHKKVFKALKKLKAYNLKVALVGYPAAGGNKEQIINQLRKYGIIEDNYTIFESIPSRAVNEVLNRSKIHILFSRKEATNRSIFEAMMAGIPNLVYKHIMGVDLELVNNSTGRFADSSELSRIILEMVNNYQEYKPGDWALANMGYINATKKLNEVIKNNCRNNRWTEDIVSKMNNDLQFCYTSKKDEEKMRDGYMHLGQMLR